ncbi:MAG: hypothetical protein JWM32_349 [Verrucomicrobia bacterium]|nr:hypothetical protein [Verrucomicrobiota bacterium]
MIDRKNPVLINIEQINIVWSRIPYIPKISDNVTGEEFINIVHPEPVQIQLFFKLYF